MSVTSPRIELRNSLLWMPSCSPRAYEACLPVEGSSFARIPCNANSFTQRQTAAHWGRPSNLTTSMWASITPERSMAWRLTKFLHFRPTSPISRWRRKWSWMCSCVAMTSPCSRATRASFTSSARTWGLTCQIGNENQHGVNYLLTSQKSFRSWATPSRSFDVKTYQEGGTVVKDTYSINMFERNVQIHSIRSIDLPMLIYLLR